MSDHHCEEQEMEAEALTAIFDTAFEVISSRQPFDWSVKLLPVDCGGDPDEEERLNHVIIKLFAKIPLDYPELSLPDLNVEIIKVRHESHDGMVALTLTYPLIVILIVDIVIQYFSPTFSS